MELTAAEARVLGCLMERAAVAPDSYPVSLNSLRLACNQSDHRYPLVAYDDRTVEDTLLALKSKGLARFVSPSRDERGTRYSHRADDRWRMGPAELSVLSVLLVGGPLTLAEVEARAGRLHGFEGRREIEAVLDTLAARTPTPFAARLDDRRAGSRARWVEVLTGEPPAGGEPEADAGGAAVQPALVVADRVGQSPSYSELAARVAELERRLAAVADGPPALAGHDWRASRPVPRGAGDERYAPTGGSWRDRALPATSSDAPVPEDLGERLTDIERRLARIEAELGALR